MKYRQYLFRAATFVVAFGLGYLVSKPFPPGGAGQYKNAPNGVWTADANSMSEVRLLEGNRDFYKFSLRTTGRSSIEAREIRIEAPSEAKIDWYHEGEILWNTNSTAVSFIQSNATWELELKMKLPTNSSLSTAERANYNSYTVRLD